MKNKTHKWSMKYKKSINCKKPRGFSQKQHCKYGRTKKRVKKTLKGGVGENMAINAIQKFVPVLTRVATGIGRGAVDVGTGVVDDSVRRELLKNQYSKQMDATKYNPVNYNNVNQENIGDINNRYRVDNSKFPNLSPKNSSPQNLAPPPDNLFDEF